ncbi:S-adenosylmethionine:tRNA ribosyltransferase-isomerase [Rudanella paleaurantiibacter]|uniref:S-adenosylmethionine:tRNA ribosyltransferase-isomerase n=1 Tax=Rudanella paleaurantiibacter TaxID=2614655 RepID=A0A7J5TTW1_9BACT|nr:S-adenosylmethionine:tRNA ribosyltransferase-isomerase [Rudanella paleaurantiibacter]KAB7727136.1 S-adenosylmethionine:tRNA ribosyltransferase-isomerase [Rudanella paleaurantiibacter]
MSLPDLASNLPLSLQEFQYDLPDDRIARFPLAQRDASRLLVYQQGQIRHAGFRQLAQFVPADSFLIFNNTKVIPARLLFHKSTGALIELFLLNPVATDGRDTPPPMLEAMEQTGSSVWQCMIGNRKRWKPEETLQTTLQSPDGPVTLSVAYVDYERSVVEFSWQPASEAFAHIIHLAGQIPLPPYLKREVTEADRDTYQTIYSRNEGAVAAPTAGLHFTDAVFASLAERGIGHDYLTLHVGAGTFQPIKTDDPRQHTMHAEQVVYTRQNLENIRRHLDRLLPVGTTSMRSLESLYWFGVKLLRQEPNPFQLDQQMAYAIPPDEQPSAAEAVGAMLQYMDTHRTDTVVAHTAIYITPGYQMKMCRGIITNFHQPGSTLILLIAALVGNNWRTIYKEALDNEYRFLSYGDSSLLLP